MVIKKMVITGLAGAFLLASTVSATYIDFTDQPFSVVQGKNSATVQNVDGAGLDLTFDAYPKDPKAKLTYNILGDPTKGGGLDGIGINDDEIGKSEQLTISFNHAVTLEQISITDLFWEINEYGEYNESKYVNVVETGYYSLFNQNDGLIATNSFQQEATYVENGVYEMPNLFFENVKKISFFNDDSKVSDFSIRGLDVTKTVTTNVPEPGFISLFSVCFLALGGLRFLSRKKILTK